MADTLYLYNKPFVVETKPANQSDYILDYFEDQDRIDQEKIMGLVTKFALDQKLILNDGTNLMPSRSENMGSWNWMINWLNMRSLTHVDTYHILINSLESNNNEPINEICDLHMRLGVMFNHKLLNTIVHRTITSAQLISIRHNSNEAVVGWEEIHRHSPFIWLIIFLQTVIRSMVKPLV